MHLTLVRDAGWQRECAAEGIDPEERRDFYQIDELQQRWEEAVIDVASA